MEMYDSKWKNFSNRYLKLILLFLMIYFIFFYLLNVFSNLMYKYYLAYFKDGTLLNPKLDLTSAIFYEFHFVLSTKPILLIIMFCSFISTSYLVYKLKSNFGKIAKGYEKGSSRFTTLKELKKQYKSVPEVEQEYKGEGGIPISRSNDKIFIDDSPVNNLIIGTTRSGKGETFIFPTIDIYSRAEKKPSFIINDPKGELFAASKETLEKRGYKVEVLNLLNPFQSMSYNLLEIVKKEYFDGNYSLAQQYARSIAFMLYYDPTAQDKFWQNSSIDLLTALILGLCEHCKNEPEKINMYNIALMLLELSSNTVYDSKTEQEISALDNFFNQFEPNHPARMQFATLNFSGGVTRSSILSNTNAKLGIFTLDGTAKLTSKHTLDMNKFGFNHWIKGRTKPLTRIRIMFPNNICETIKTNADGFFTLYHNNHLNINDKIDIKLDNEIVTLKVVSIDEDGNITFEYLLNKEKLEIISFVQFEKPIALFMIVPDYDATFNVIASLYVKQVYTTLARTASFVKGGKCFRKVVFLLDEFGNMPTIDDFASILTVCLGRNMRFNLIVQAYAQIEKLYGKDWETIDGNTNNTIYILTDDEKTAKKISEKIGEKTVIIKSRSGQSLSFEKTKTENVESRPLLTADELMRLKEGESVVIRTIKRQDKEGKRIRQFPIFNTGKTSMKYRWEYLSEYFDTNKSINEIDINCVHANLDLNSIKVNFFDKQKNDNIFNLEEVNEFEKVEPQNIHLRAKEKFDELLNEKQGNGLDKSLFKKSLLNEDDFENIFGDFKNLSILEIKDLLVIYKEKFKESMYFILQKIVDEQLE